MDARAPICYEGGADWFCPPLPVGVRAGDWRPFPRWPVLFSRSRLVEDDQVCIRCRTQDTRRVRSAKLLQSSIQPAALIQSRRERNRGLEICGIRGE